MIKSNRTRNRKIKAERDLVNNLLVLDQGMESESFIDSSKSSNFNTRQESYIPSRDLAPENSTHGQCPNLALTVHQPR